MSMHFVPFRSVFGNKDDGYVKRIDDFAADDDDYDDYQNICVNKPPVKEDERNRKRIATDLLTEVCVFYSHTNRFCIIRILTGFVLYRKL